MVHVSNIAVLEMVMLFIAQAVGVKFSFVTTCPLELIIAKFNCTVIAHIYSAFYPASAGTR